MINEEAAARLDRFDQTESGGAGGLRASREETLMPDDLEVLKEAVSVLNRLTNCRVLPGPARTGANALSELCQGLAQRLEPAPDPVSDRPRLDAAQGRAALN